MCTDVLILAGGSGERLWPVSTAAKPKQFMTLEDGDSFLQSAIRRAWSLGIEGKIIVVTRSDWTGLVVADAVSLARRMGEPGLLSKMLVMSEPFGKNTAPAIAWACRYLLSLDREESPNVLLMASDHIIKPLDSFVRDVRTACWYSSERYLSSFSIPPSFPSTGYGYIKAGAACHSPLEDETPAYRIETFKEKPDTATARQYIEDGHYFWNSGLYAFRADLYLEELARHAPAVSAAFEGTGETVRVESREGVDVMTEFSGLERAYEQSPSISIDYAVSEKCDRSVTVQASFLWDDVGTWDSLAKYFDGLPENAFPVESRNCFVQSDIPVALCGVDDVVVVIRNGKALVARKGETNLVKDALGAMKRKGIE